MLKERNKFKRIKKYTKQSGYRKFSKDEMILTETKSREVFLTSSLY